VLGYAILLLNVGFVLFIPAYAAWGAWPEKRWQAASAAAGWTSTMILLIWWLVVRF
jgi:hypothetical protein